MSDKTYIVAGSKPWNEPTFRAHTANAPGNWIYVSDKTSLSEAVQANSPRYVFFPHWSWIVPDEILESTECVCFHMTDVPYGRGGSPLQNLIVRGHTETKLTALRMTNELDAGPVYAKRPLSLAGSSAEEIYIRASEISAELAVWIATNEPTPEPQKGEPVEFKRRKAEQSLIPDDLTLEQTYDFIRMLDADGYPSAAIQHGNMEIRFNRATRYHDRIEASVTILSKDMENES